MRTIYYKTKKDLLDQMLDIFTGWADTHPQKLSTLAKKYTLNQLKVFCASHNYLIERERN